MSDDLDQLIRRMAEEETRTISNQILWLIGLGLKSGEKQIKNTVTPPENWQVLEGGKDQFKY